MKKYCKDIDISDINLITRAINECLSGKILRKDTLKLLSETSNLSVDKIKEKIINEGYSSISDIITSLAETLQKKIKERDYQFPPIWYSEKIDGSSQKLRRIGIQNIKQQIYDYIAVMGMDSFINRIGEYQCASIKERGQMYGIKSIQKWLRNKSIKYAGKCDIRKCYPSIDREKLMVFLSRHIENDLLLDLISHLIYSFEEGLSIGSYLSQFLCNLYLSEIYHEVSENMYRIRKKKNGTEQRVNLVMHTLFYMDDILILGSNAKDINKAMKLIIKKAEEMGLTIKDDWRVYQLTEDSFIDMMGVRIYRSHTTIRSKVFIRIRRTFKRAKQCIDTKQPMPLSLARKCISYYGILKNTDSFNFCQKYKVQRSISVAKRVVSREMKFVS